MIFSSFTSRGLLVLWLLVISVSLPGEKGGGFPIWGFYAHQLLNKLAVFTLPYEILPFYKSEISYISAHAVDPDKRRYSSPYEAIRHYIDLDYWEKDSLPLQWKDFARQQMRLYLIQGEDTVLLEKNGWNVYVDDPEETSRFLDSLMSRHYWKMPEVLRIKALPGQDPVDGIDSWLLRIEGVEHGIVPYHIARLYSSLTKAFERHDWNQVLKISAGLGHYVADAHVPLHTTSNYDGQQTAQEGIHAFWETRIPELMAETRFDLFVEKASYIPDVTSWAWEIVRSSYEMVPRVLSKEDSLAKSWPPGRQYIYVERGGQMCKLASPAFATAYERAMDDMVEQRMRATIQNIGSLWFTAWVDAGQPDIPRHWKTKDLTDVPLPPDSIRIRLEGAGCH